MGLWTSSLLGIRPSNSSDNPYSGAAHDIGYQSTNPRGIMTGGSNPFSQIMSQRRWRGERADARGVAFGQRLASQSQWMNGDMDARTQLLNRYQGEDDAARNRALGSISQAYADPQRAAGYDQSYQARLGDAMAGINQNYQGQAQQASLAAAAKGRLGSSYDGETQARLRAGAQMSTLGAQGDASDYANSLRDTDYQQAQAMRRSLLSGDPQSAAAYQGVAAQASGQASALSGQSSLVDRQRLLNQAYGNAQSQQIGGYGNALAGGYSAAYGAYGRA